MLPGKVDRRWLLRQRTPTSGAALTGTLLKCSASCQLACLAQFTIPSARRPRGNQVRPRGGHLSARIPRASSVGYLLLILLLLPGSPTSAASESNIGNAARALTGQDER